MFLIVLDMLFVVFVYAAFDSAISLKTVFFINISELCFLFYFVHVSVAFKL